MEMTCGGCGTQFDPLRGAYAPSGEVVCESCGQKFKAMVQQAAAQRESGAFVGSIGALLFSVFSVFVQYRVSFLIAPLLGIVGGALTARAAATRAETIAALGKRRVPTIVFGLLAVTLGVLSLALNILARV